jgi:hypothetical protein
MVYLCFDEFPQDLLMVEASTGIVFGSWKNLARMEISQRLLNKCINHQGFAAYVLTMVINTTNRTDTQFATKPPQYPMLYAARCLRTVSRPRTSKIMIGATYDAFKKMVQLAM